uniref:Uncharacterized protein n=1 Tax=Romanomermis culicivorax TaxID=13658 RepID=A0A915JYL1_ROMCU
MLGILLVAKLRWEVDMQIDKVDDQRRRHLHRSGAPQKDGMLASPNKPFTSISDLVYINYLVIRYYGKAKGQRPMRQRLLTSSERKTYKGILKLDFCGDNMEPKRSILLYFTGEMQINHACHWWDPQLGGTL